MKLNKFYSLRTEFIIIGLTGRVGAGCSEIAKLLSNQDFINGIDLLSYSNLSKTENIKNSICYHYLRYENNFKSFQLINYKDVLFYHLIHECNKRVSLDGDYVNDFIQEFINVIAQNGSNISGREAWRNRLDAIDDKEFLNNLKFFLLQYENVFKNERLFGCYDLNDCLSDQNKSRELFEFFFGEPFLQFAEKFYKTLNNYDVVKRTRLTHDLANNLRANGTVKNDDTKSFDNIYTIAETINRIIKAWRKYNPGHPQCRIVIDALKNSLELMYFKEKYSGFYIVAANKDDDIRRNYLEDQISKIETLIDKSKETKSKYSNEILKLDDAEYKSGDYKKGKFSTPDIENCIQKSDYHIYITPELALSESSYLSLEYQIIRFVSLICQPGIITPTSIERSMQVAFNAKYNSGCISRQVGAVVTDQDFSIKAIGWNDVPQGQVPCNLRSMHDLLEGKNESLYSEYEKGEFKIKVKEKISENFKDELSGRNCSYCFKSFQNAIEGEKNQVHTRSLHAEENAMMQIAKYGGQGLKGGNLFTTASPCELCSKKAYQLGIKNIYYIDPYPGIATAHILKSGLNSDSNPKLIMYQGAVGRAYHKLYEPFMAYKDEISLITGIDPKPSVEIQINNLIKDETLKRRLLEKMEGKTEEQKVEFLTKSLGISLQRG